MPCCCILMRVKAEADEDEEETLLFNNHETQMGRGRRGRASE